DDGPHVSQVKSADAEDKLPSIAIAAVAIFANRLLLFMSCLPAVITPRMHMLLPKVRVQMTVYGYARVSTNGQTLASQDAQLHAAGAAKVYAEKMSGARTDRPELAKLLKRLDAGDVLMVTRLDRLARSTRDLLNILDAVGKADG